MNIDEIRRLYNELDSPVADNRKVGRTAMTLLAMIVSAVPCAGGPASFALDKAVDRWLKPDIEEHLKVIEREMLRIAPHDRKIETLEERIEILAK
ncbi:MAG TPA: hypothetical protein VGL95_01855, partial [Acetobacteraceae bacterium]